MNYAYLHDKITEHKEIALATSNRAFKYGDGLFESILVVNQNPVFMEYNLQRLLKGMQLLAIEIPENWDADFFRSTVQKLCKKNKVKNARCKITVWRSGEGLYKPEMDSAELLIELFPHADSQFVLNTQGLVLGIYDKYLRQIHPLSACKTCNALHYVLAAKYAYEQNLDDVVLLNTEGKIADAVGSNVFVVMNNSVFTTTGMNGGIEGTMQEIICQHATEWSIKLERIEMTKQELLKADEVFLTNAVQGVKWVKQFEGKEYGNTFSKKLTELLNTILPVK